MKLRKFKFIYLIFIIIILVYGILWLMSFKKYEVDYGVSFNKWHADSLGLDWKHVYTSMLDDLKVKYIRISATWSETEWVDNINVENNFIFEDIDWQMDEAKKRGVKVVLVIGQKAPRWPECHVPFWTKELSDDDYEKRLLNYVEKVVERYKNHEALEIWQVENEPFIRFVFGECERFNKDLTYEEIDLVHSLDPNHKIIVTDSGELSTWRKASKAGDIFGTTLYRIVRTPGGKIFNYDWLPAKFYWLKALIWKKDISDVFVSELQAEPWFADSEPNNTSVEEQEETMNLERLKKHIDYVEKIGISRAYLWGVEWWYWMGDEQGDWGYWEFVKTVISNS